MFMTTDIWQIMIEFIWLWLWLLNWNLRNDYWIFPYVNDQIFCIHICTTVIPTFMLITETFLKCEFFFQIHHAANSMSWWGMSLCIYMLKQGYSLTGIKVQKQLNYWSYFHAEQQWVQWWEVCVPPPKLTPAITIHGNIQMMCHQIVHLQRI